MSEMENQKTEVLGLKWYVLHTYSGYENKVANDILTLVENRKLGHLIRELLVPTQKENVRRTKKTVNKYTGIETETEYWKEVETKRFPGYVYVNMVNTPETWFICRNTRGVTGFIGQGVEPIPLTEAEVRNLRFSKPAEKFGIKVGERVNIKAGKLPFGVSGENCLVKNIEKEEGKVVVIAAFMGREMEFTLTLEDVEEV